MGIVTIYKETDFRGDYIPLRDGFHTRTSLEYADFYDQIRSLRVKKYTVANFQQSASQGSSKKLALRGPVDVPDITALGIDKISRIEVYTLDEWLSGGFHPGRVTIYNREQFSGKYKSLLSGLYNENRLKSQEVGFYDGIIYSLTIDSFMGAFLYSSDNPSDMPNMFILGPARVGDVGNYGFSGGTRAIGIVALRGYDTNRPNRPLKVTISGAEVAEEVPPVAKAAKMPAEKKESPEVATEAPPTNNRIYTVLFIICLILLVVIFALLLIIYKVFYIGR